MRLAPPRWAGLGKASSPANSAPDDRPARLLVVLVVFVFPRRAAAVAHVAGEGDGAARAVFLRLPRCTSSGWPGALRQLRWMPWQGSHSDMGWSSRWRARSLVI